MRLELTADIRSVNTSSIQHTRGHGTITVVGTNTLGYGSIRLVAHNILEDTELLH